MRNLILALSATMLLTSSTVKAAVVFTEDFEGDLSRWTGQTNGPTSGIIVPDPVGSGRGHVLTFTNLTFGGDIFTTNVFSFNGTDAISFDYLGLPGLGGVSDDLGGFLGVFDGYILPSEEDWKAGTQETYPGIVKLIDDGTWHRYTVTLAGTGTEQFRLAMEDYVGSGGVAGDCFFDNIQIQTTLPGDMPVISIAVSSDGH